MKKLLLTALLAVSATAFAGLTTTVTSGTESLALPVTVKGNVVEATKLTMELTALDNAGPDGRTMTFNFGDLVKGISKEDLVGTFQVRLLKNNDASNGVDEIPFSGTPIYELVGGNLENSNQTSKTTTPNKVKLTYQLGSLQGLAGVTKNTEKLTVTADSSDYNTVQVGQFTDAAVKIKVTLSETNNPKK